MNFESTITTIDVGSSKIKTIIAGVLSEPEDTLVVLGIGNTNSTAIRKGNILDIEDFKANLDKSLLEAEKMSGEHVSGAYLSFSSSNFEVIVNKGVVAISGDEITSDDVDRVLDMAKNGIDLPNKEILKIIPEYFVVDLEEGVKNPIGMSARKLEVVAHIFVVNSNILNNIRKAIADVGIEIIDIYPNLLSSAEGILTKRQKELGVVCVDIGASTTGVTVFEEGVLKHSAIIPVGGDNVTNDIALGTRTSIDIAERLKVDYSELTSESIEVKNKELDYKKLNIDEEGGISLEYLSNIATARYEEILNFVKDELIHIGKDGMLPEGVILVGGASKEKGLVELSKDILKLPSFVGIPSMNDELVDATINDPAFSGTVGNLFLAQRYGHDDVSFSFNIGGLFKSILKILKKIMP